MTLAELVRSLETLGLGSVLKRYSEAEVKLKKKVGQGGFGIVYKCDIGGEKAAIRLEEVENVETTLKYIETRVAASKCQNVCPIDGYVIVGEKLGLVMRRYSHSVQSLIEEEFPQGLPPAQGLKLCLEIARAIQDLHTEANILHMILSPGNVLVDYEEGQGVTAVGVTGFSMSLINPPTKALAPGFIPQYSPLEQLNKKEVDGRTDVYALGCTFNFIVSGEEPWPADYELVNIISKMLTGETVRVAPHVPESVRPLIDSMVKLERDQRPSIEEVVAKLRELSAAL